MGVWLSLRTLNPLYVRVLYILQPLQKLVIHLVARISKNTTPITNRLELLTLRSPTITQINTSKLLEVTTILIIAISISYSSQDTKISAISQLSKQDKR